MSADVDGKRICRKALVGDGSEHELSVQMPWEMGFMGRTWNRRIVGSWVRGFVVRGVVESKDRSNAISWGLGGGRMPRVDDEALYLNRPRLCRYSKVVVALYT